MQEAQVRPPWKAKVGGEDLSPPLTLNWQLEVKGLPRLIEPALEGGCCGQRCSWAGERTWPGPHGQ